MFKKLINNLKEAIKDRDDIDPSRFNDPVAMETEWGPAKKGGASFCTHKLHRIRPNRVAFKMTAGAMLFGLIFALVGIGVLIGATVMFLKQGADVDLMPMIMMTVFGLVFGVVGIAMLRMMSVPSVIDTKLGLFWKGRQDPRMVGNRNRLKTCVELDKVHAVQIIREYCRSSGQNSSSYYSYEVNFVLHDGSRVTVVDHGNHKRIRQDAEMLSQTLGVPLWDAS